MLTLAFFGLIEKQIRRLYLWVIIIALLDIIGMAAFYIALEHLHQLKP